MSVRKRKKTSRRLSKNLHVVHEVLKDARARMGASYTLRKVSSMVGISVPQLSHYETGTCDPPVDAIRKLCITYNISADSVLGLPGEGKWSPATRDEHLDFLVRRKSLLEFFARRPSIREVRVELTGSSLQVYVHKGNV